MLDYVAGTFELTGFWLLGNHQRYGFILNLIGWLLWAYVAVTHHIYGLLMVAIPAVCINIRNFVRWEQKDRQTDVIDLD